jgi:hypothetical protein
MRLLHSRWLLALTLAVAACDGPTLEDIEKDLERQLSSVEGPWTGTSPTLTLDFQLTEGAGNAVSGTGTMKEAGAANAMPINVTGTFLLPQLSLTFTKMVYEGRAVQGTFQHSYTTVGGMNGQLHLTGTAYSKDVTILLQER